MTEPRTRLAPSPTGALHLGNARTFLVNWAMARRRGWRILLRIEDLDGPRVKSGADRDAIDTLRWLGIDWDEGPTYQRSDLAPYHAALDQLRSRGLTYPCRCTRSEIASAQSAPHAEGEPRYPGTCRTTMAAGLEAAGVCQRFVVRDGAVAFDDAFAGPQAIDVQATVGDFIVATKARLPAYQLAVVVDDARQGVTHIVRGDDLIASTARQIVLYDAMDLAPRPWYCHLPLVVGPDGRRLAKRHGDTRLAAYRERGVSPRRVIGLLGEWCGIAPRHPMTAGAFLDAFELKRVPRSPVVMTDEDDRWLMSERNG